MTNRHPTTKVNPLTKATAALKAELNRTPIGGFTLRQAQELAAVRNSIQRHLDLANAS